MTFRTLPIDVSQNSDLGDIRMSIPYKPLYVPPEFCTISQTYILPDIYIQGVAIKKWPPWNFSGFDTYCHPIGSLCIRVLLWGHHKHCF